MLLHMHSFTLTNHNQFENLDHHRACSASLFLSQRGTTPDNVEDHFPTAQEPASAMYPVRLILEHPLPNAPFAYHHRGYATKGSAFSRSVVAFLPC